MYTCQKKYTLYKLEIELIVKRTHKTTVAGTVLYSKYICCIVSKHCSGHWHFLYIRYIYIYIYILARIIVIHCYAS